MALAINPKKLSGPWDDGVVLDAHMVSSEFIGYNEFGHPIFDSQRTELGQALYQLKYNSDRSKVGQIAETVAAFVKQWQPDADLILPIPASTAMRRTVRDLCAAVASEMGIEFCEDCLTRAPSGRQVKNIGTLEERKAEVAGSFSVREDRTSGRRVLLLDDLYQTGTTLAAAVEELRENGRVAAVFVLALTHARKMVL